MVSIRGGLNAIRDSNPIVANMTFWQVCMVSGQRNQKLILTRRTAMTVANDLSFIHIQYDVNQVPNKLWLPVSEPGRFRFEDVGLSSDLAHLMYQTDALSQRFGSIYHSTSVAETMLVNNAMSQTVQSLLATTLSRSSVILVAAISNACRMAAILHIVAPMGGWHPDPALLVSSLVQSLKVSLSTVLETRAGVNSVLMLWLFYIGAVCALNLPERAWFVSHLVVMLDELQLEGWDETKIALTHVMWHAVFCESSFQDVWVDIEQARETIR